MPKTECKYGEKCYQKNSEHLTKYSHTKSDDRAQNNLQSDGSPTTRTSKRLAETLNIKVPDEESEVSKRIRISESSPKSSSTNSKTQNDGPNISPAMKDLDFISDIFDREIRYSQRAEYKTLLESPKDFIRYKFLVQMPDDFFNFWEFCKSICKENVKPETVFEKFGLLLVGPFDVLAGKFDEAPMYEPGDFLRHWRFYYDVPEFQTILVKKSSGVHYGYWRDDSTTNDCFVARADNNKGCEVHLIGKNIFSAVLNFFEKEVTLTPFNRGGINSMKKSIEDWITDNQIDVKNSTQLVRNRNKDVVCRTFHKAGLVVPIDRKTKVGYRPLSETEADLKKILAKFDEEIHDQKWLDDLISELQPLITNANIANDEGDFGTSIELGLDLFCHGSPKLHDLARPLLVTGYSLVQRPQFIAISKSHMDHRRRGTNLSIFDTVEGN